METSQKLVFGCKGDASGSLMLLPEALQPHVQVQGFNLDDIPHRRTIHISISVRDDVPKSNDAGVFTDAGGERFV